MSKNEVAQGKAPLMNGEDKLLIVRTLDWSSVVSVLFFKFFFSNFRTLSFFAGVCDLQLLQCLNSK